MIEVEIAPRWDAQRRGKRRREVARNRREVQQRIAMGPVLAGAESDDRGRWAVRGIMAVRRHEGRRGRPLDVLVEWEGEDSDGDVWEESWVSVTELTAHARFAGGGKAPGDGSLRSTSHTCDGDESTS